MLRAIGCHVARAYDYWPALIWLNVLVAVTNLGVFAFIASDGSTGIAIPNLVLGTATLVAFMLGLRERRRGSR